MANKQKSAVARFFSRTWKHITNIIVGAICLLLVMIAILITVLSFIWMPILMWVKPNWTLNFLEPDINADETDELELRILAKVLNCLLFILRWVWMPTTRLLPMKKRQYFINWWSLYSYPTSVQLKYFRLPENRGSRTVGRMSNEAIKQIWKSKNREDRISILEKKGLRKEWAMDLVKEDEELLITNLKACPPKADVQKALVQTWTERPEKEKESIYKALLVICGHNYAQTSQDSTLDDKVLKNLIDLLKKPEFYQRASTLLKLYGRKKSLGKERLEQLVQIATDKEASGHKEANDIFIELISRDGIALTTIEKVFESDDSELIKKVQKIVKLNSDKRMLNEPIEKWENFCNVTPEIDPEVQERMNEEQYDVFIKAHTLAPEAVDNLLNGVAYNEHNANYFRKVLRYAYEKGYINEYLATAIYNCDWKRDIAASQGLNLQKSA